MRVHVGDGRAADARRLDDVDGVDTDARPDVAGAAASFLGMWIVMMVAMMLRWHPPGAGHWGGVRWDLDADNFSAQRLCLSRAPSDETVGRLCTAPSVGPVTAAAFSSTVDDVQRFQSAHQVEAYLGLTPSEWSSGEKQCKGHITKAGNNRMRKLLVQVAVSILRLRSPRTEALRKWSAGIAARRGKKIAIVALARRMAGVLFAMLRDRTCYNQAAMPEPSARLPELDSIDCYWQ